MIGGRNGARRRPLRTYFAVLVSLFVVVALAAVVYVKQETNREGRHDALTGAGYASRTAAAELGDYVTVVQATVAHLASNPKITHVFAAPAACSLTFAGVGGPDASHVDVLRPDGSVACSSRPSGRAAAPTYAGAAWLRRALRAPSLVAPVVDPATGTQVAVSAAPIPHGAGVVVAFVDLVSIGPRFASLFSSGHPDEFLVTTGDGRAVLARSIDPRRWVGQTMPPGWPAGSGERHDLDGTARLYAEQVVAPVGWRVLVGEDKEAALAAGSKLEHRQLVIILVGLAVILLGSLLVYRSLVSPIRRLSRAVQSIGTDATAMLPTVSGPAEVTALGEDVTGLITRVTRELQERERAEARSRAVLEVALDAVITIDRDGRVLEFNPAAEEMFGYARAEVLGRSMAELLIPERLRPAHHRGMERYLASGKGEMIGKRVEISALRSDGTEFPAEIAISRVPGDGPAVFTGYVRDISERQRAEQRLSDLAAIVESSRVAIVGRTVDGVVTSWNAASEVLFGHTAEKMIGSSIRILAPADRRDELDAVNARLSRGEKVEPFETVRVRKDGTLVEVESTVSPILDRAGRVVGASAISRDISERKRAERDLLRLAAIIESSDDAIVGKALDGTVISWNKAAERIYGYTAEEMVGRSIGLLIPPEQGDELAQILERIGSGGHIQHFETTRVRKDGNPVDVSLTISPLVDDAGQIVGASSIARDITGRKEAEGMLREAERRYRTLIEQLPLVTYIGSLDPASPKLYVSPQIAGLLGYPADEWLTNPDLLSRVLHPEDRERVLQAATAVRSTRVPTRDEYRCIRPDGSVVWLQDETHFVQDTNGEAFVQGYLVNATERHLAVEQLSDSEERYRDLFENATDLIATVDLESRLTSVNAAFASSLGYSPDELVGRPLADLVPPEEHDELQQAHRTKRNDGTAATVYEHELLAKDGGRIQVEVASRLIYRDGLPVGTEAICRDISERKHLEDQLRQSQRLESVGRLAGGIAHDFNNLLTVIGGYAEALLEERDADSEPELRQIAAAAERAAILTRQLLAFSRRQARQPRVISLNDVVDGVMPMLSRLIGEDIDLVASLDPALEPVFADPNQIEQVVLNLAINARDAMPNGGKLTIETGNTVLDESYVANHPDARPGRHATLIVSDTGSGMDSETMSHLFEPFFTTKPVGSGTGLGLSTVHGITKQSDGTVWVYSEPDKGSTFKIFLPAVAPAVAAEEPTGEPLAVPTGSETILIVEDEAAVRELATDILTKRGYTVLVPKTVQEAIQLAEQNRDRIDLLLTDLVMPEVGGAELAAQITGLIPDLRVLFMSGYADEAVTRTGALAAGAPFLEKPFSAGVLAHKVRETLDGSDTAAEWKRVA